MATVEEIQNAIARIDPGTPMESVVVARDMLKTLMDRLKEMKREADEATVAWIEVNGPIEVGEMRTIAVNYEKDTTCIDVAGAVEAIVATDGGFPALCGCLSTGAMKHGAAKKVLSPAEYERLFKTRIKPVIKDGKTGKALAVINAAFLPQKGTRNILDQPLPEFELT